MTVNYILDENWVEITPKGATYMESLGHCDAEIIVSELIPDGSIRGHILRAGKTLYWTGNNVPEDGVWMRSMKAGVKVVLVVTNKLV